MSSNHIELRSGKKKRKVFPHHEDDETAIIEEDTIKKETNHSTGQKKTRNVRNPLGWITKIKQGIGRWRRHVAKRKLDRKGDSESRDGPCGSGLGLCALDEKFTPNDLKESDRRQAFVASQRLHEYFKMLEKQSHVEDVVKGKGKTVAVNFDSIEHFFELGARIDWPDEQGQTVLHEAVRAWRSDVTKYLYERGGNPGIVNIPDNLGRTPLHVAAKVNNVSVAKFLLDNGADPEARTHRENQTPVHYAAKYDSYDMMKYLIKSKCDYKDVCDYKERTPLQLAAEYGISHMVSLLLELNAPVNVRDDQGQPAVVLIMKNTRSLAKEAMDQFVERDPIRRQRKMYINHMVPRPEEGDSPYFQTPLEVITTNRYYDMVTHDIIKEILRIKWKHFGRCGATGNLILNLIFIIIWTVLGVYPDWMTRREYIFPHDSWRVILWIIAVVLTVFEIVTEIMEYKKSKMKLENWKTWKTEQLKRDEEFCHPLWPREEVFLEARMKSIKREQAEYIKDWWNIMDWICYIFLMACILTHLVDIALPTQSVTLSRAHIRIMVVTLILVWLRLMKSARAFSPLGPFIAILGQMINDFGKFIFLLIDFYIPYCAAFWMIFGGVKTVDKFLENPPANMTGVTTTLIVPGYGNVQKLFFSIFRLVMVDDYPYDDMYEVDPVMTDILLATWFGFATILCLNLFIALLSDTFQRVYDNAHANALMLKALTILDVEHNLPPKQLKMHLDYLYQDVLPREYDDEDTKPGESDLKKVAFQVKYELEEMREWFTDKFGPTQMAPDLRYSMPMSSTPTFGFRRGSTHPNEMAYLFGEVAGIKQDVANMKDMLKDFIERQGRGGGGNGGGGNNDDVTNGNLGLDVVDGVDEVDDPVPYTARSQSLIPLYDAEEYRTLRAAGRRHARKKKKKRKQVRQEEDDVEAPRGLVIRHTSPIVEVDSLGYMEPPPQQVGLMRTTPEPEHPDSTEA